MIERLGTPLEFNDGRCREIHVGDVLVDPNGCEWQVNKYKQLENEFGEKIGYKELKRDAVRYKVVKTWNEVLKEQAELASHVGPKESEPAREEKEPMAEITVREVEELRTAIKVMEDKYNEKVAELGTCADEVESLKSDKEKLAGDVKVLVETNMGLNAVIKQKDLQVENMKKMTQTQIDNFNKLKEERDRLKASGAKGEDMAKTMNLLNTANEKLAAKVKEKEQELAELQEKFDNITIAEFGAKGMVDELRSRGYEVTCRRVVEEVL